MSGFRASALNGMVLLTIETGDTYLVMMVSSERCKALPDDIDRAIIAAEEQRAVSDKRTGSDE